MTTYVSADIFQCCKLFSVGEQRSVIFTIHGHGYEKSEAGVYTRTKQRIVDIVGNPFFLAYLGSWWRKHPFH